jgi:hypothetical protein
MAGALGGWGAPATPGGTGSPPGAQPAAASAGAGAVAAGAGSADAMVERLKKLDALKAAGVLSDDEYQTKRQQILSEI